MASSIRSETTAKPTTKAGGGVGRLSSPPSGIDEPTNQFIQQSIIDEGNPFLSSSLPIDTRPPVRPPNPSPILERENERDKNHRLNQNAPPLTPFDDIDNKFMATPLPSSAASMKSSSIPSQMPSSKPSSEGMISPSSRLRSISADIKDRVQSVLSSPHTSSLINNGRSMASKGFVLSKNALTIIANHSITQSHIASLKQMMNEWKQSVPMHYQLLAGLLGFTHLLWPLLYFWSAYEARVVVFCSFFHLLISHFLYYQYQRLTCTTIILPALLWILPALFLFLRPGVGEELSVELAIALHNAGVSPRHVIGLYEVFSSRWYSFLIWYRFALIITSALLPFVILHNIHHYSFHFNDLNNNEMAIKEENQKESGLSEAAKEGLAEGGNEQASSQYQPSEFPQRKPTVSVNANRGPFQSPLLAPANRSVKDKQFFPDQPLQQSYEATEGIKKNENKNESTGGDLSTIKQEDIDTKMSSPATSMRVEKST